MTVITILEREGAQSGPNADLRLDHGETFAVTVSAPLSEKEEAELEWYFEEHLKFPFTDQVKAERAARSVQRYGEALFEQLFESKKAYSRYKQLDLEQLQIEIVGSPEFHRLHWEALKDPDLPQPLALLAPLLRRNKRPQEIAARAKPSPTINVLLVTARPHAGRDVGYRTIARPLVESLRQARAQVRLEMLRPGSYQALVKHLESVRDAHGAGFYHVIHFDVHGALLPYAAFEQAQKESAPEKVLYRARWGRDKIEPYQGVKAFLFLEGDEVGQSDPVEASELAKLLLTHQVPIAVLNACQSAKQANTAEETSLGSHLMDAGMQRVLAMSYSVTVTAAQKMMQVLYEQLFDGKPLATAIRRARLELYNDKERRAYFNQKIELEDWLLPVVYQNQPQELETRAFTPEEEKAYHERRAARYQAPRPRYGFFGRDLDVHQIERRLLRHNLLLVRGMGGAGKSSLLHHLGEWWQTTHFVEQVFYFGYDERAWTRQQIMHEIARPLLGEVEFLRRFQPLGEDAQQAMLAQCLRAERRLLILDNLESITGTNLAIPNTLTAEEQGRLRGFLTELVGGRTLVLLGSRGGETWLTQGNGAPLDDEHLYDLPGLDREAASQLAERILEKHKATKYRDDEDLQKLLKVLAGYPLALEVVLANLARQSPAEVLAALQGGDEQIDFAKPQSKTESILKCIDHSHSNLSAEAQGLLACLAPFTGVLFTNVLGKYSELLRQEPALAHLPFERWPEVLQEAIAWGLLQPHEQVQGYLRLQPIFPYFLRNRLQGAAQDEQRQAIHRAFRQLYDIWGGQIGEMLEAKEPQPRQTGFLLAQLEYENLATALELALEEQTTILNLYAVLDDYFDATQNHRQGLALGEIILARLENYPPASLKGPRGAELVGILDGIATRQLNQRQFAAAEASYQKALSIHQALTIFAEEQKQRLSAGIYHQLGRVAQEQRQWAQAERYYQQALQLKIEFNARYNQASTYHQLGVVAQEQRQWAQAERYYQQALQLFIEFNARYEQASTYHQLGRVAQEQRQWAQAERYYQQALQLKIEFNARYEQASTYHQLGRVAQEQRQWTQAERYYQQALQIFIEFNDRYQQASTYGQLGIMAQEQRQWAQAERYYQQALQLKIEFNDRYQQAKTYHQLGRVAQEQRQWAQAERYYQQALQLKIEFNDRYQQASTYHGLGIVAQEQRQWAQAEHYYQQALQLKIEFNARYQQASTYHQLGRVAQAQRQWAQARTYFLQALPIYVEYEDSHNASIAMNSLARLWRASGDEALPAAIAPIVGMTEEEVRAQLAQLAGGDGA